MVLFIIIYLILFRPKALLSLLNVGDLHWPSSLPETWPLSAWELAACKAPRAGHHQQTSLNRQPPVHRGASWRATRTPCQRNKSMEKRKVSLAVPKSEVYTLVYQNYIFQTHLLVKKVILELFFTLAAEVSHEPLGGKGILSWHPPSHDGIQEGFSLARIKAQYLTNTHRHTIKQMMTDCIFM